MKYATSYLPWNSVCDYKYVLLTRADYTLYCRYEGKCANETVAISILPSVTYRFSPLMPPLMFIRVQLIVCSIFLTFINYGFADYAASQSHGNGGRTYVLSPTWVRNYALAHICRDVPEKFYNCSPNLSRIFQNY